MAYEQAEATRELRPGEKTAVEEVRELMANLVGSWPRQALPPGARQASAKARPAAEDAEPQA